MVGAVPCEERFGMGDADSAAVCMDASQAMLLISHSGTSMHGKLQLCNRNKIKSAKEAGVRSNSGLDKCWQAMSAARKLSKNHSRKQFLHSNKRLVQRPAPHPAPGMDA